MSKPNVLVITQQTAIQDEFKNILANKYEHLTALNGIDGVVISRMAQPAIIVVDLTIAQPSAVEICKALLSDEGVRSIPVIVLADTPNVDGELSTLENFKEVLQRPIQAEKVRSRIQSALEAVPGAGASTIQKPAAERDELIRVLSVDDSSVVRKLVTMILTAEGFKVTTASDGLDGVNKAKELIPDIILLDFVMPKMNGFEVCRILQKDEKLRQIPVILVTSKGDKVGDKFVNQLGVTGYITKPFQPEELVSKIHQTLDVQKEEAPVQEAPQAPSPAPQAKPAGQVQPAATVAPPSAQAPQAAAQLTADAVRQIVQEEVSRVLAKELGPKVNEIVKRELSKLVKSIDKRIEKRVIEKMNEYIRRAKKK